MRGLLDFLSNFYWLSLPETVAGSIWRHRSLSPKTLAGLNDWPFFVATTSGWGAAEIDRLLSDYDIPTWGWGFQGDEQYFRVRRDQAALAQRVMLSNGVPILHRLYGGDGVPARRRAKRRGRERGLFGSLFGG